MSKHSLKKLPRNTFQVDVKVSWDEVKEEYRKSSLTLLNELTVEGYRKGKAPKQIAEKHLPKKRIYDHLIKNLLQKLYEDIIKQENLKPVVSPKVDLVKAKENEDWEFSILLAEKPEVVLGDYKKNIKEAKEKNKKADIWVPGKDTEKEKKPSEGENHQANLNIALSAVLSTSKVEISDLILEEEFNHRLARLLDDVQKLGLTIESYLKSKGITIDQMKEKIKKEIEETYKLEFILSEVAEKEDITVDQKDLDALFSNIKNEAERKAAQENAYLYATILRKQKTLEFLSNL
ncbi:MAG: hypothetical protein HYW86_03450 [Candidatus Roizmanbacteria bacterium]|nr:MAG: hypothetical protein HYW86_03450 [Candidatus Roizmanbacteria bacterium]